MRKRNTRASPTSSTRPSMSFLDIKNAAAFFTTSVSFSYIISSWMQMLWLPYSY